MKKYKPIPFLLIQAFFCLTATSQTIKTVPLAKYTPAEGLSSYYITKIIKDAYGFMWIGTQEGLNLFDGRNFEIFSKRSVPARQLGGSFVIDMVEDRKRNLLWVLTAYGDICAIDLTTRQITKRIKRDNDGELLRQKWIRSIAVQDDILWIGGLGVITAFNIVEDAFLQTDIFKSSGMSTADCNIAKFFSDSLGRLWIFSDGYGISLLSKNFKLITSFRSDLNDGAPGNKKLRFWDLTFNHEQLYVSTSWGVRVFEINEQAVTRVKHYFHGIIDTAEVLTLTFSTSGRLFFSTPNKFYAYNLTTDETQLYDDRDSEDNWLTLVYQVFYDSVAQKIWLGTQSGLASFDEKIARSQHLAGRATLQCVSSMLFRWLQLLPMKFIAVMKTAYFM